MAAKKPMRCRKCREIITDLTATYYCQIEWKDGKYQKATGHFGDEEMELKCPHCDSNLADWASKKQLGTIEQAVMPQN